MNNNTNTQKSILDELEAIASEVVIADEVVDDKNFVARLVICYTDEDKHKYADEYKLVKSYADKLDKLSIKYKAKANKYFYLLNKSDFSDEPTFQKARNLFVNKKQKIFTITLKNIKTSIKFLDYALKVLSK